MIRSNAWFVLSAMVVLSACADADPVWPPPAAQQVLADSIRMAPGDVVVVEQLRLTFLEVSEDSRCPIDAVCVWQGNAAVRIAVGLGRAVALPRTLNTSEALYVDFGGYRVWLLQLLPAPRAGVSIPPADYSAVFRVESLED